MNDRCRRIIGYLAIFALVILFIHDARADDVRRGEIIAETMIAADWAQTRDLATRQTECKYTNGMQQTCTHIEERNQLLGSNPTIGQVNTYFASMMIAHYLLDRAFPERWQERLENVTIVYEVTNVAHNRSIGLHFKF